MSVFTIAGNVWELKEVRDLKPKYFLPPQKFISSRNAVLFFAYIKITNFREATKCRQKTYTSARIFFRYCYKLAVAHSLNVSVCIVVAFILVFTLLVLCHVFSNTLCPHALICCIVCNDILLLSGIALQHNPYKALI